ncbi:MAG: tRNA (guanosine(46)-N7)-methyltransferase TrmB [Bacteroidia bacterium]|nr:tRNA (guanosine(46)-N7)-methyltransferase TrmB [Bacteroidia bacterium]MCF8427434.1 tRNA (guanosine(46)-N7)-methyltransferase TrmB [Bacteroidia bacterium]
MAKDKLRRFAEFLEFPNCFDYPKELKGKWNSEYFKNNNPIVLELACGKGEYTVNLAEAFPEKNFIGIDIKSNRMWVGARMALNAGRKNVAFARLIIEKLEEHFEKGEVSEIWITFPDPFPKDRHEKHRLTHPRFLKVYKEVIAEKGLMHFKTDDDGLFTYTEELFAQLGIKPIELVRDVHGTEEADAYVRNITTHYEKLFRGRGRTIKYMKFILPDQLPELNKA